MKQKIIVLSYGEMATAGLKSLLEFFDVRLVVTPPQEPNLYRRSEVLEIEKLAEQEGINILRTNDNKEIEQAIHSLSPDALVICSYNKILPSSLLLLTKCINVHHGDLPRWRGRANFNWAIILGRDSVGLTIHEAVEGLDSGNIYEQYMIPISEDETIATLYEGANKITEQNLGRVVKKVLEGYGGYSQRGEATYCCTRLPQDGYIDWSLSSLEIDRLIRALTKPFPGTFTYYKGEKMIVWSAEIPKEPPNYEGRISGRIIAVRKDIGVEVLTGDSSIIIKDITYKGETATADHFVKTVNASLGLNLVEVYELIKKNLKTG